jgi:hypothetical protein
MTTLERTLGMLRVGVVVGCLAMAGVLTGTANAEPTGGNAITVTLYNCSGPAGTPSSFDIQKEPNPGVAAHVVGETFLFKRTSLAFPDTGEITIWGPKTADKPIITCMVVVPSGRLGVVTGFFTGS